MFHRNTWSRLFRYDKKKITETLRYYYRIWFIAGSYIFSKEKKFRIEVLIGDWYIKLTVQHEFRWKIIWRKPLYLSSDCAPLQDPWQPKIEPIEPIRVLEGQVHAMAKHVTHPSECRSVFGLNWASKLVNGTAVQCYYRVVLGNTRPSTFIVATFIILGTQKTKETN